MKRTFIIYFLFLVCLFIFPAMIFAMSEDEYAQLAAQNYRLLHESKGDHDTVIKKSQEFLDRLSDRQKQEYIQMAQRILEDKKLAKRISKKIIEQLTKMGYNVDVSSEGDLENISIAGEQKL